MPPQHKSDWAPDLPPALTHRQLSMFRNVMLHGNLSRAAEAAQSSQPTLSRELARPENGGQGGPDDTRFEPRD